MGALTDEVLGVNDAVHRVGGKEGDSEVRLRRCRYQRADGGRGRRSCRLCGERVRGYYHGQAQKGHLPVYVHPELVHVSG